MCSWVFCALSLWYMLWEKELFKQKRKTIWWNKAMYRKRDRPQGFFMLLRKEENASNWWIEWNVFLDSKIVYLIHGVSCKDCKAEWWGWRERRGREEGSKVGKGEKERKDWTSHLGKADLERKMREGKGEAKESRRGRRSWEDGGSREEVDVETRSR